MIALARHSEINPLGKRGVPQDRKMASFVDSICGCCRRKVINTKERGSFLYERLPCRCQQRPYDYNCGRCVECCLCPTKIPMTRGHG